MMKQIGILLLAVCLGGAIGAAVERQVTRKEFEAAVERIAALERQYAGLKDAVMRSAGPRQANLPMAGPQHEDAREWLRFFDMSQALERMTQHECNAYAAETLGRTVEWSGRLVDATEKRFGGYELFVDVPPIGIGTGRYDVSFGVGALDPRRHQIGEPVFFKGRIAGVSILSGSLTVRLDGVEFYD